MAAGPAWQETGLVFVREDGVGLDPVWVSRRFHQLAGRQHSPASACTTSANRGRQRRSVPAGR
jgi:hypothetical protein